MGQSAIRGRIVTMDAAGTPPARGGAHIAPATTSARPPARAAASRIPDVAATDVTRFAAELERDHRLLLHLAEGTDDSARRHFLDLQLPGGSWALSDHLIGIHSVGLQSEDIPILAAHGA